jgi:(p)ppGpp synthase/HD superfamily hydrolase
MDLVTQAAMFATQKHVLENRQLYGNVWPYTHHLVAVRDVAKRFFQKFMSEDLEAATLLHDVVEDTRGRPNEVRVRDIEEIFGEEVARLVEAVTTEDGPNRKARNALTYPKIRKAGRDAVVLKLADRIANVEFGGRAVEMYRKEHDDFWHGIGLANVDAYVMPMRLHLDKLLDYTPA